MNASIHRSEQPVATFETMSIGLALRLTSARLRILVEQREDGRAPLPVATVFVRKGRLYAIVGFEGTDRTLQIPLDVWPTGWAA
ncbi:MAG TPA: hypothetical protein VMU59_14280 [Caulobacteraceae bacterium]|nr:hypothetical protein [Caulobacteraceae bacterium]